MLILLYNLYSLLFLLKNDINDIIFIEYSNRIACSNRVKQRCLLWLQWFDERNNRQQRNKYRRGCFRGLHRAYERHNTRQYNDEYQR